MENISSVVSKKSEKIFFDLISTFLNVSSRNEIQSQKKVPGATRFDPGPSIKQSKGVVDNF